ncbi:MAG: DUF721 domain-containing protein [Candidatus Omnitrophica bacterium]|nr:DUF721 domain-containing protein [Candidatus Omnitrophota bacterium]MBU4479680.1 DUF721 domain-containing protein [Candidatus Omnitrophota bacterium]MCG2703104.1 DUF721 domain-containing protein [Candidatus Omnitrophota bacterium]
MDRKIVPIAKIIEGILEKHEHQKKSRQAIIIDSWKEIMPAQAAQYTAPAAIKNNTLTVVVSNSAWLHHLTTEKKKILKKINHFLGETKIDELRFKIGSPDVYQ